MKKLKGIILSCSLIFPTVIWANFCPLPEQIKPSPAARPEWGNVWTAPGGWTSNAFVKKGDQITGFDHAQSELRESGMHFFMGSCNYKVKNGHTYGLIGLENDQTYMINEEVGAWVEKDVHHLFLICRGDLYSCPFGSS